MDKFPLYVLITCTLLIVNERLAAGNSDTQSTSTRNMTHQNESAKPQSDQSSGRNGTTGIVTETPEEKEKQKKEEAREFFAKLFANSIKLSTDTINNSHLYTRKQRKDHNATLGYWIQHVMRGNDDAKNEQLMFLSVGGFESMEWNVMNFGPWVHLAKKFDAKTYQLENRFYDPDDTQDYSPFMHLSTDSLQYLNIEQLLADIVYFIQTYNNVDKKKIIVCGVGFGGNLAAWLRLMNPVLVSGAVIYNAPLMLTMENKKYYELLKNELNDNVKNNIREAYKQIRADITQNNYASYKTIFKMCDTFDIQSIKDTTNTEFMFWSLTTFIVAIVKLKNSEDAPEYGEIIEPLDHASITNPLDKFASAVKKILNHFEEPCLNVDFKTAFEGYKSTDIMDYRKTYPKQLNLGLGSRQTHWLHCKEIGMFNTSDGENTFGEKITLEFYAKMCKESFDFEVFDSNTLDENVKKTNTAYGGQNIGASRIIYISRGDNRNMGITESPTDDRIAIHIEDEKPLDQLQNEHDLIKRKLENWTDVQETDSLVKKRSENATRVSGRVKSGN